MRDAELVEEAEDEVVYELLDGLRPVVEAGARGHDARAGIADGRWQEMAATCLLLWLVLLPYFGFRGLCEALGRSRVRDLLLGTR